jgi:hypothetical protein
MKNSVDRRICGVDPRVLVSLAVAGSALLSACGGGGGGSSSTPPPITYSVGGSMSGLNGSVVLQNNGGGDLTVSTNGTFTFAAGVSGGAAYAVTVRTQPSGQNCTIPNGSGTANANVNTVTVSCQTLLSLSSSTPASEATEVARDVQPALVFSAALDAVSASAANITLSGGGGAVASGYQVVGTQVTLRPHRKLKPLTQYTLTVGTGLRGQGGEVVPSVVTRQFTTRDLAWGAAKVIESEAGDASTPQVAADGFGNAFAVWVQSDGERDNIWSNRYAAGTGWGVAKLIDSETGNALSPQVAVDASGNAVAVWTQYSAASATYNIWSNHYVAGADWGTAQLIGSAISNSAGALDMNASGNAVVAWNQYDVVSGTYHIWSNRYVAEAGWGTAQRIENEVGVAFDPQVAVDASGNANVIWVHRDLGIGGIWSNRYVVGTNWGAPQRISEVGGDVFDARIAVDAGGNAIAVWEQQGAQSSNIVSNRYVAGMGWGAAQLIEREPGEAYDPQIAIDAAGNAAVTWEHYGADRHYGIWSNRYHAAGADWGTAQRIENEVGNAYDPQVAVDASGNATVVWHYSDGMKSNIWSSRYAAGTGWGPARLIGSESRRGTNPQVAVDANGDAVVVWQGPSATGGADDIQSNRLE